ncbi:hypothetical protein D7Y13_43265, partial [Corallococcus praedator]
RQLAAIVARLDEQDNANDQLSGRVDRLSARVDALSSKIDRLSGDVATLASAVEQALTSFTNLGRRVVRLEHPDGGT